MKLAGIVGGMGPESTILYYQSIISKSQERMGSKEVLPELLLKSINMYKMFELLEAGEVEALVDYLASAVQSLEKSGADFACLSANTPHIVFEQVQQRVQIPMISIVEETYHKAHELGLQRVGLIGTKFTMENDFFKKPFTNNDKSIIVPKPSEQEYIHQKIVEELENGVVNPETKKEFLHIMNRMIAEEQIQGVILGCTELPMLFSHNDLAIPQLNTTDIHVNKIVDRMFAI